MADKENNNEEVVEETTEEVVEEIIDDEVEIIDEAPSGDEKDVKIAELTDKLQRTMAEFDNFRKRTMKEKATRFDDGIREAVEKLLPVIDNFGRAIESSDDKESSLYKGIAMVNKQCMEILLTLDVEEIKSEGEQFDPNFHNAVQTVEEDGVESNVIVEVLQKGYICKDKIIRPSMVKVNS